MCPLQLQVSFNSGSYVTIPTTTHFFQWANRTHSNFKVLKCLDSQPKFSLKLVFKKNTFKIKYILENILSKLTLTAWD